jgi:hypothetical protein
MDFPGSQAAWWTYDGTSEVVELCEWSRWHGGAFKVAWRYDDNGPEIVANTAYAKELTPIGPVARALFRRFR